MSNRAPFIRKISGLWLNRGIERARVLINTRILLTAIYIRV